MNELPKTYNPKEVEDGIYKKWEESGYFNPDNLPGDRTEPFVVALPPPNVTGVLHLGHALENSIMDIEVRFQRMLGKKALLIPGTDHAAVATQARVEKNLIASGQYKHPREELGREKLLEIIREFAEQSKSTILSQMRKMGTSYDWSRLAYTFDEQRSKAVNELFIRMYNDGLVYRGFRTVNWSVKGQSTNSDDELEYVERTATLYTFKYSKDFPIAISTTRPETKLGDTAVAVHPEDTRYKQYIGKTFTANVGAAEPLSIKIIADKEVDPAFGTGALGVTPAHSQIDYEMYAKRKGTGEEIGMIQVIGSDGKMTAEAGKNYVGLSVELARDKFVGWLRSQELIEREEDISQNVGTSQRFGDIVEVIPMEQWFVAVNKEIPGRGKSLKDLMRDAVTMGHNGDANQKVTITPERFHDSYLRWIDHLRDWCISRQIWWGHRIPVYYRKQENPKSEIRNPKQKEEIYIGLEVPEGEGWEQDPDTLDTWFSSGAWTFSTLGWPDQTDDLKQYHPTTWMQMGYEILFFWMARMILMSTYALDQIPFKDVYIHGMLRDEQGRKFSKSLGNGIDPIEACEKYGTDALRLSLVVGNAPGNDSKFSDVKVEHYKHFINKLWNITRLVMGSVEAFDLDNESTPATLADKRILSELRKLTQSVTDALLKYQFSEAAEALYEFSWHEFADWYLEIAKVQMQNEELKAGTKRIMMHCLMSLLKLWHPFIPFVSEHIYQLLTTNYSLPTGLLMVAEWPKASSIKCSEDENRQFQALQSIVSSIRNFRSEQNVDAKLALSVHIRSKHYQELIQHHKGVIERMTKVSLMESTSQEKPQIIENGFDVFLDLPAFQASEAGKEKERTELQNYIVLLESKLANKDFVVRAPETVVNAEQQKLEEAKQKLSKLES